MIKSKDSDSLDTDSYEGAVWLLKSLLGVIEFNGGIHISTSEGTKEEHKAFQEGAMSGLYLANCALMVAKIINSGQEIKEPVDGFPVEILALIKTIEGYKGNAPYDSPIKH